MRPNLSLLAGKQSGVFTWQQARVEYTRPEIETRISRGHWVRVFRGVYRHQNRQPTPLLTLEAARLSMDASSVIACRNTAAQLHGFSVVDDPTVHLLTPDSRMTRRRSGLIVHRDHIEECDLVQVGTATATNALRTAIDTARTSDRLDALAILDLALRNGLGRSALTEELELHAGKRGCRHVAELLDYADPRAESPMESRTRLRCIDAGLPRPELQVVVRARGIVRRLDLGWERWKIGLEYESKEWHSGPDAPTRDNPRHNWLQDLGWQMFYVGPNQVYRAPHEFTDPIRRSIARKQRSSA